MLSTACKLFHLVLTRNLGDWQEPQELNTGGLVEAQSDCIECNEPKVKKLVMRESGSTFSSLQSFHCLTLKGPEGRMWFLELL